MNIKLVKLELGRAQIYLSPREQFAAGVRRDPKSHAQQAGISIHWLKLMAVHNLLRYTAKHQCNASASGTVP